MLHVSSKVHLTHFHCFSLFFNRVGDGNKRNVYRVRFFFPLKTHVTFTEKLIFEVL